MENQVKWIAQLIAGVFIIFCLFFISPVFTVDPGQVGITFNKMSGRVNIHSPGMHFRLPFIHSVDKLDVKTQRLNVEADSASKDLQQVKVHVVLNYHLMHEKVGELYVKVGSDFSHKVIDPAINEAVKAAASQFPVEEIIVKRQDMKKIVEDRLRERLSHYFIIVDDVNLVDINFTNEFNHIVEQKQIEEQKIKTAEYQRRQSEEYKKKTILEAEAETEKQRMMKQTITENLVAMEWIKKWNGQLPTTVLGDKSSFMFTPEKNR